MKTKWEKKIVEARKVLPLKQQVFFDYLKENPGMTYRQIQDDLGISLRMIFIYFKNLEEKGYVKRYKTGKEKKFNTCYEVKVS